MIQNHLNLRSPALVAVVGGSYPVPPDAPPAPTQTAASSITTTGLTTNWGVSTGATGYRLDVSTDINFGSFVSGFDNLDVGNVLLKAVTGLTAGTTYYSRVRAYHTTGTSGQSNTITTPTLTIAPTATAATNVAAGGFSSNWGAVTGATSYRLDVSTDIGFGSFVSGFQDLNVGNVTTHAVSGLSSSTTYYYRVRGVNASGSGASSNIITQATSGAPAGKYLSTTGSDGAAGTFAAPWATFAHAINNMSGGDLLLIRGGTYDQHMDEGALGEIPGGSSWATATLIQAYPGETPIFKRSTEGYALQIRFGSWIIFDGITWDSDLGASGCRIDDDGHHIRFINCISKNVPRAHCWLASPGTVAKFVELINCEMTNWGWDKQPGDNDLHGAYISCGDVLIEDCIFDGRRTQGNNGASWCIHNHSQEGNPTGSIFRRNICHNSNGGIICHSVDGTLVYQNLIYDCIGALQITGGSIGVRVLNNVAAACVLGIACYENDNFIENNICYNCSDPWDGALHISGDGNTVKNNLSTGSTNNFEDEGTNTVNSGNLIGGSYDPQFVNFASRNFHIGTTSSAKNAGLSQATYFTTDFDGVSRPQGASWDIGPYEFV